MLSRVSTILAASGPALVSSVQFHQLDSDVVLDVTFTECQCSSVCSAREADNFNCDMCSTEGSCGGSEVQICRYPEDSTFEAQNWEDKMDYWWGEIEADATPQDFPNVGGLFSQSVQTSFDNGKDEMPEGRTKTTHSRGSMCKFELDITAESPYTGLLAAGKQEGLIRMGNTVDPESPDVGGGVTPGLGFKFARTGVRSGNLLARHSFEFAQGWNFFEKNMSNINPAPAFTPLKEKFQQPTQCAPQLGISDLARYSQDGSEHSTPLFPFKLFLVPNTEVQRENTTTQTALDDLMASIPVNTRLFSVYACEGPSEKDSLSRPTEGSVEEACGYPLKLGDVVTTSYCTTSKYGDERLHFRHQRIEEDWILRPEFFQKYDARSACGLEESDSISPTGAPPTCEKLAQEEVEVPM